jgi:putative SOS response-associated peptidase YedK
MCGRITLRAAAKDVATRFDLAEAPDEAPRYKIAPTQLILAVREAANGKGRE